MAEEENKGKAGNPDGQGDPNPDDNKGDDGSPQDKETVPLYKFKKANDRLKETQAELEKYKKAEQEKQEKELLEQKNFEALLAKKDADIKERDSKIESFTRKEKEDKINKALAREIKKHKPNDPEDVLLFVNKGAITIVEDDEGTFKIEGVEEQVEALKKSKPYLFGKAGSQKKDDKKSDDENNKSNAGAGDDDDPDLNKGKLSHMSGNKTINNVLGMLSKARKSN